MNRLADQIGLEDDAELGPTVKDAKAQIEELKDQRRVIAEWTTGFDTARQLVLGAYRKRYAPAYRDARTKVELGRTAITDSEEFGRLGLKVLDVRIKFMGAGCALQEIPDVPLNSDADLIAATSPFPLPLLAARISGADKAVAEARAFMDELLAEKPKEQLSTWDTSRIIGKAFADEAKVDEVFDKAKDEIKTLIRQGKTVRTI